MEILTSDLGRVADIAFFLLLAGIALRSLLLDRDAQNKQRVIWKEEFTEIESAIRTLIEEATKASEVFDTRLTRKHKELETLLQQAESFLIENRNVNNHVQPYAKEKVVEEHQIEKSLNSSIEVIKEDRGVTSRAKNSSVFPEGLRSVTRSNKTKSELSNKKNVENEAYKNLEDSITSEFIASRPSTEQDNIPKLSDEEIFAQTSIVDPAAFRIAKRLLLDGKELHVVSRKMDLPVSEIRHLETLLREQARIVDPQAQYYFSDNRVENVSRVIRDTKDKNLDESIEERVRNSLGFEPHAQPKLERTKLTYSI